MSTMFRTRKWFQAATQEVGDTRAHQVWIARCFLVCDGTLFGRCSPEGEACLPNCVKTSLAIRVYTFRCIFETLDIGVETLDIER